MSFDDRNMQSEIEDWKN